MRGRDYFKMDKNTTQIISIRIQKTMENLKKNNMEPYYVDSCAQVVDLVKKLCPEGRKVSYGGSMTLEECGVLNLLRSGKYEFLDRAAKGADPDAVMHQAFSCDTYFMSTNAITENGELYNVDGRGNRVAALIYGPKNVIVIVGYNKIVSDLNAAAHRVCEMAAPANTLRLNLNTPCTKVGVCCDCHSADRICCNFVVSKYQKIPGRIKVIIVGEPLGY